MQEGENEKTQVEDDPLTISLVTPTGGLRVDGSINGVTMSFLVDTGAAVTLLRKDTWDDMYTTKAQPDFKPGMEIHW